MNWKITAIIFIILFGLHLLLDVWMVYSVSVEEEKMNVCLYDICEYYPDAMYEDNVCYCHDYDMLGELIVAKTKYMRFNEACDFHDQSDIEKLEKISKQLKKRCNVITYGTTARKDLKFKKNRNFIIRGSGWKINNSNGQTKVIEKNEKVPKGYVECPGDSCGKCVFCKVEKKINVVFRRH